MVSDMLRSHSVGSTSFESSERSDAGVAGVSGPSQKPSSASVSSAESAGEATSLGDGEGDRISVSLRAWDWSCAVKAVMEGCRGAPAYL